MKHLNLPIPHKGDTGGRRRLQAPARTHPRAKEGQSLVEFALALPILLLLLLGTLDMGQMFFQYIQLRGAVREAAAAAARTDCGSAYSVAQNAVTAYAPNLENAGASVNSPLSYSAGCPDDLTAPESYVTVTAHSTFTPLMADFWNRVGIGPFVMTADATAKVWS